MKKQILFMMFLSLAFVFAGLNSYAQAVGAAKPYQTVPTALPVCLTPTPFTDGVCETDALHPVQGKSYDYTVTINEGDKVRWFVVNNNDLAPTTSTNDSLISPSGGILPRTDANIDPSNGTGLYIYGNGTDAIANYNTDPTADNTTISIAWKYFDGITDQVILVAYVEGADGCTNNIAAYRIIPQPAFTIDVASFLADGSNVAGPDDDPNKDCVSPIESAVYSGSDETPDGTLTVDYGENWVYFIVNGANYIDSWRPQFQISYSAGISAAEASWAYRADADDATATNWNSLTGSLGGTWTSAVPVIANATAATAGTTGYQMGDGRVPAAGGECIIVRVRLDWGTDVEHDQANGILTFAVDGVAYDGNGSDIDDLYDNNETFGDLHWDSCDQDAFANDVVTYLITPRPQVEDATAAPVEHEDKTGDTVN